MNGEMVFHASYTINEALIGCVIGGVPAVLLPFLLRRHPIVVAILDPFMVGGYGAPKLAFAPLFILWFGIGIESKIALVAAVVFFIVYFSTLAGVRALEPSWCRWRSLSAPASGRSGATSCFPARCRRSSPAFASPCPMPSARAVIAELISSNRGLGYLVQTGAMNFDTTQVFVAILAATLIVHVFIAVVDGFERFLLRWRPRDAALAIDHGT